MKQDAVTNPDARRRLVPHPIFVVVEDSHHLHCVISRLSIHRYEAKNALPQRELTVLIRISPLERLVVYSLDFSAPGVLRAKRPYRVQTCVDAHRPADWSLKGYK